MKGSELLDYISLRLAGKLNKKSVTRAELAKELNVTPAMVDLWRKPEKKLTPRKIFNLLKEAKNKAETDAIGATIKPIIEFFYLDHIESKQGAKRVMFSTGTDKVKKHVYLEGLKNKLEGSHGIYVFLR